MPGRRPDVPGYYAYWCGLYHPFNGNCFSNFNICCGYYDKCNYESAANCEGWYGNTYF